MSRMKTSLLCVAVVAAMSIGASLAQTAEETIPADEQVIEQIERDSEAVITGGQFSYDPGNRRDPFEPLIKSRAQIPAGKRPKGVAGMLVSEIALKGIALDTGRAPVALFNGSDNRGYTLRVGDIVYDGRVIAINKERGTVVFRQQVDDPRRIKPYRDVVKRLYPLESLEDEEALMEEGA